MLTTRMSDAEAALRELAVDAAMSSAARAWLRFFRRLGWGCRAAAKAPVSGCCALEVQTSTDPGRWLPVFVDPLAAGYGELKYTCTELRRFGDCTFAEAAAAEAPFAEAAAAEAPFAVVCGKPIFPADLSRDEAVTWDYTHCFRADGGFAEGHFKCGAWHCLPPCLGMMRFMGVERPWFLVLAGNLQMDLRKGPPMDLPMGPYPTWAGVFTGSNNEHWLHNCPTDDPEFKPVGYFGIRGANWADAAKRMWLSS
jgi:hypothetical protein